MARSPEHGQRAAQECVFASGHSSSSCLAWALSEDGCKMCLLQILTELLWAGVGVGGAEVPV